MLSHNSNSVRVVPDEQIYYGMMVADSKVLGWAFQDFQTKELINGLTLSNKLAAAGATAYFRSVWVNAQPSEKVIRQIALQIIEERRSKSSL